MLFQLFFLRNSVARHLALALNLKVIKLSIIQHKHLNESYCNLSIIALWCHCKLVHILYRSKSTGCPIITNKIYELFHGFQTEILLKQCLFKFFFVSIDVISSLYLQIHAFSWFTKRNLFISIALHLKVNHFDSDAISILI